MLPHAVNNYATSLKCYHEIWMDRVSVKKPEADPDRV